MVILYSQDVEGDLDSLADYIAADSPRRAVSFLREIYAEIERIGEGPLLYQLRPDIGPDARLAVEGRYVTCSTPPAKWSTSSVLCTGGRELPGLFDQ